jgi:hypothetical protein
MIYYTETHQTWYHIFSNPLSLKSIPALGNKIYQKGFVNLISIKVYKLSVRLHEGCQSSMSEKLHCISGICLWAALQELFFFPVCWHKYLSWNDLSMKYRHTNKKYINKAPKHLLKLTITWIKHQLLKVYYVASICIWSLSHINSILFKLIYEVACDISRKITLNI